MEHLFRSVAVLCSPFSERKRKRRLSEGDNWKTMDSNSDLFKPDSVTRVERLSIVN